MVSRESTNAPLLALGKEFMNSNKKLSVGIAVSAVTVLGVALIALTPKFFDIYAKETPTMVCADMVFGTASDTGNATSTDGIDSVNLPSYDISLNNCYRKGEGYAVRVGSSKSGGTLTIDFSEDVVISAVKVYAYKWNSDSQSTFRVTTSAYQNSEYQTCTLNSAPDITDSSTDPGFWFYGLDDGNYTPSSSLTIETQGEKNRLLLCKLVIRTYTGASQGSTTTSSSTSSSSSSSSSTSSTGGGSTGELVIPSDLDPYYDDIDWTLSPRALKSELSDLISNHTNVGYDGLWNVYKDADAENGYYIDMYSDETHYRVGSDHCGSYRKEGDCINREHSIPKSWFNDASPMVSDAFQVVPTDGYVNNRRGNYPFGEVKSAKYTSLSGCKLGSSSISGYSGTVFEPMDKYKGDFARIYFYFVTCYEDRMSSWSLSGTNLSSSSASGLTSWSKTMFLNWASEDPISTKETKRNDAVERHQHNRNPYVDVPGLAEYIFGNL